jgi:hypothetical protein
MTWMYVSRTGEPLAAEESELPGLAQHGLLVPATLVWHPGRPDWVPVAELKPEIFGPGATNSASLNLGRAVLEPLWQRRGWLLVLAGGLLGVALLRTGVAAFAAWPDLLKLGGVGVSFLTSLTVIVFLARWWRQLGRAAATNGLQEARDAARAGGQVLVLCGFLGFLLLLLTAYDVIGLVARAVLKG